ncbi:hypothetical protein [uncultured Methanobrevibacter sp.]|nr:hypothetical protein [uncultured Methanobrevibacter sp.]
MSVEKLLDKCSESYYKCNYCEVIDICVKLPRLCRSRGFSRIFWKNPLV